MVESPQNILYKGKRAMARKICGVSILRAGEVLKKLKNLICTFQDNIIHFDNL